MLKNDRNIILNKFDPVRDNLLLILHEVQNNNPEHYISEKDMKDIADYLNISYSSVYGVVTYYSMFSRIPRGKYIIRVCTSPVCEMTGSKGILQEIGEMLGLKPGETTGDKLFTLETTECLGRCDESPGVIINEEFYGRLTTGKLRDILNKYKSGKNG
jgi:NADH-quinone oxidoreductase subunit E